jgi:hypothetical protein
VGAEVWFAVTVPASTALSLRETSVTDVVLERVASCTATSCLGYADTPETLNYTNSGGAAVTVYFVIERYSAGATGPLVVEVTLTPV